ncbi:glycosyltransferase family 9 protein [Aurantibacter sp.]|uniref:glycosyltransferase family 9 protein n=1 Tax=Aurantibacter sp. TaxID=2807103 RepID=UPI00326438C1
MKILLVQQKMIGDVLVSSLLCEHIKEHLPQAEVHYVIEEHTTAVVEQNPYIDKIVLFRKSYKNCKREFYAFLKNIKGENYDVTIDVYGKIESNLISYFSNAPIKIAYPKWRSKFIYSHLIPIKTRQPDNTFTTIDDRLALLSPIISENLDASKRPKIYLNEKEIIEAQEFLRLHKIDINKSLIMLGVLGSGESKTYPLNYMAQLIDLIADQTDATLLFNYIPSQANEAKMVYDLCKESTKNRIALDTFAPNLRKFIALLNCCDFYIGNEGGSTNMAKALGVPTFSIFAPWIDKIGWSTFADEKNLSIHVADYFSEELNEMPKKKLKKESRVLYKLLKPENFQDKLINFLSNKYK